MRSHRYLWALGAVLIASCYDYSAPSDVVNGAVVITQQSQTFNPAGFTSYYLDPVANVFENTNMPASTITIDGPTAGIYAPIGQAIDSNMQAFGYTKLPWPAGGLPNPPVATPNTVGIHVTFLKGTVQVYYPGYWCDYWYYYSCYYSWSYAGSYNTGSMIVEMGDLSQGGPPGTSLPVAWLAAVYGVAGSASYNVTLAVGGLNRAFAQSPYLHR